MGVIFKQRHRHHIITFTVVILTFVFEKKYFFIILQYNHDLFFFEILRRNPLSKCWPKMIPPRTSCRRNTSHLPNITYIGLKDARPGLASFKPMYVRFDMWEVILRHDVRRGIILGQHFESEFHRRI